jgi:hypothetical protein
MGMSELDSQAMERVGQVCLGFRFGFHVEEVEGNGCDGQGGRKAFQAEQTHRQSSTVWSTWHPKYL